jgi:ABC-type transport system involved in Fe-S cluster assembly fused permease/ATPase subunit
VTLLVSHRFSIVRMADLILVLDKGKLLDLHALVAFDTPIDNSYLLASR